MTVVWRAESLCYRYPGSDADVLHGIDLEVRSGEVVAVIGPNGSGKSTLLRLLLGSRRPDGGRALLFGRPASEWDASERARHVAALPQHEEPAFPITVGELVGMGRYPWLGRWGRPGPHDRAAVAAALDRCRVTDLAGREFATLSGGERQRARLARALAQEPAGLALDEPTAALDLAHEMDLWRQLREEAATGRAVLLATHHLNRAARFADRLVLLDHGRAVAVGPPAAVLAAPVLESVWGWPVRVVPLGGDDPDREAPQVVPRGRPPADRFALPSTQEAP
ncbi:MAG TPA: ABC transporter ATP-binding protein [Gemmatimonadota bacterium]|nr:ABC transporter ATP-binding protein [Gemmatimonadota bacterium]